MRNDIDCAGGKGGIQSIVQDVTRSPSPSVSPKVIYRGGSPSGTDDAEMVLKAATSSSHPPQPELQLSKRRGSASESSSDPLSLLTPFSADSLIPGNENADPNHVSICRPRFPFTLLDQPY
jgi:hypothetical protein